MLLDILKRFSLAVLALSPMLAFAGSGGQHEYCRFARPGQLCVARIVLCPRTTLDSAGVVGCDNHLRISCNRNMVFNGDFTVTTVPGGVIYRAGNPSPLGAPAIAHATGVKLPATVDAALRVGDTTLTGSCRVWMD